jgi:hypothetical protein
VLTFTVATCPACFMRCRFTALRQRFCQPSDGVRGLRGSLPCRKQHNAQRELPCAFQSPRRQADRCQQKAHSGPDGSLKYAFTNGGEFPPAVRWRRAVPDAERVYIETGLRAVTVITCARTSFRLSGSSVLYSGQGGMLQDWHSVRLRPHIQSTPV